MGSAAVPQCAGSFVTLLFPGTQQLSISVHKQRLQLPFGKGMLKTSQTRGVLTAQRSLQQETWHCLKFKRLHKFQTHL